MRLLIIISFLLSTTFCFAQKDIPFWVTNWGKSPAYPSSVYLTGMAFINAESADDQLAFDEAFENAKSNLSEKLLQQVESETQSFFQDANNEITDVLSSQISSKTKLDITGLDYATPYFNRKENKLYILVYTPKDKMKILYNDSWNRANTEIKDKYETGQFLEEQNKRNRALTNYYECQTLIAERNEYSTILTCLGSPKKISEEDIEMSKVLKRINILKNVQINDIDDLVYDIQQSFKRQMDDDVQGITINNPLLADLKVPTELSRVLKTKLEIECSNKLGWKITDYSEWQSVESFTIEMVEKFRYTMHGSYRMVSNNVVYSGYIFDMVTGKEVATYRNMFDVKVFDNTGLVYTPGDYRTQMKQYNEFAKNDLEPSALKLMVNTNKGNENPIFKEGEQMELSFKVNHSCYIRIIYHLADGARAIIADNEYFGEESVGRTIPFDFSFTCSAPFGIEIMQVNASSVKFPPLNTFQNAMGYTLVKDPLDEILRKTRSNSNALQAEQRIVINTVEK